jgi:hypothetical protein
MVWRKIFKSLVFPNFRSSLNRKSLYRKPPLTLNGEIRITLKVAKHGFFEKIILYNFQSFTHWPNSSHFNDIFGKYRFNMNDNKPQHPGEDLMSPPKQVEGMKVLDSGFLYRLFLFNEDLKLGKTKLLNIFLQTINLI